MVAVVLSAGGYGIAQEADGKKPAAPAGPKLLCEFKIATGGRPILLPVKIAGKTYKFMMDTGASHTTFDDSLRPMLGKPRETLEVKKSGKTHKAHTYCAPDATVGPLNLRVGGAVMCVDLSELREVTGLDIRGVIGMGMLRRYVIRIDFDRGVVQFFAAGQKPGPDWGSLVNMSLTSYGVPVIDGTFFGEFRTKPLIDTGFYPCGMISEKLFKALTFKKLIYKTVETQVMTADGNLKSTEVRVDDLLVGENHYSGLIFIKGRGANMLGLGFLSRHVVTFDFPNVKLYLKKGRNFNATDQTDMSGLHLLQKTDAPSRRSRIVTHSVDAGSPAAGCGLKAGDVLEKVNGRNTSAYGLMELRELLKSSPGKKISVTVRREGKVHQAEFVLKQKI